MTYEEGDSCPKCSGTMGYADVVGCYCHVSAPCSSCVNNPLVCLNCGYNPEEEEEGD